MVAAHRDQTSGFRWAEKRDLWASPAGRGIRACRRPDLTQAKAHNARSGLTSQINGIVTEMPAIVVTGDSPIQFSVRFALPGEAGTLEFETINTNVRFIKSDRGHASGRDQVDSEKAHLQTARRNQ